MKKKTLANVGPWFRPLPLFKRGGEQILFTFPRGGDLKNFKKGWKYGAGASSLKANLKKLSYPLAM